MSREIKPCPFCGSTDISFVIENPSHGKWGHIECQCGVTTGEVRTDFDTSADAPWHADALAEWNTRKDYEMHFVDYQVRSKLTDLQKGNWQYHLLGLSGEVGEIANKLKKVIRDDRKIDIDDMAAELGDCLWYLSQLATDMDIPLDDIAQANLDKLADRAKRGAIQGDGDNR